MPETFFFPNKAVSSGSGQRGGSSLAASGIQGRNQLSFTADAKFIDVIARCYAPRAVYPPIVRS